MEGILNGAGRDATSGLVRACAVAAKDAALASACLFASDLF